MLRKLKSGTARNLARTCAAALSCACLMAAVPAGGRLFADPDEPSETQASDTSESSDTTETTETSSGEESSEETSDTTESTEPSEPVSTENAIIIVDSANVRNNPGTVNTTVIGVVRNGKKVTAGEVTTLSGDPSGSNVWCQIEYTDENGDRKSGYVVDEFLAKDADVVGDETFEAEIADFPSDYKPYLRSLHRAHPTWHFRPMWVGRTFEETLAKESRLGVSLIYSTCNDSWKSTESGAYDWSTGEFIVYDGKMWVNAAKPVVAYYLDPRNMLGEQTVFQFLDLSYDEQYQTIDSVQGLLNGTFMESDLIDNLDASAQITYAEAFMLAAQTSGANPVFLAAKCLQEVSVDGSASTSGDYYSDHYQRQYTSLYNYYNIGASSDRDPVAKGLAFARDGSSNPETNARLLLPWTTRISSIVGGSIFIANAYINMGQNTTYLMKFNVHPNDSSQFGNHQYMTNIQGSFYEAKKMYKAYDKAGILGQEMVFSIPVYDEMPETPSLLPREAGNPNDYLRELSIEGYILTPQFDPMNCQEYSLVVSASCTSVHISATPASDKASVSGDGDITLEDGVNTISVMVTAENGSSRVYTINIARNTEAYDNYFHTDLTAEENYFGGIDPDSTVGDIKARFEMLEGFELHYFNMNGMDKDDSTQVSTGDLIQIVDADGNTVYIGALFIRGDANGDGKISSADLTLIARSILGEGSLSEAGRHAADANKDGRVTAADLTLISKHILQEGQIVQ
ncbi:MAG: cadherin-like beta sandwich domain-containing protein [Clostridiales bacterium]|nr:cadherin-like beta sandwich domain-containing protein [Clostridiales bacterium]